MICFHSSLISFGMTRLASGCTASSRLHSTGSDSSFAPAADALSAQLAAAWSSLYILGSLGPNCWDSRCFGRIKPRFSYSCVLSLCLPASNFCPLLPNSSAPVALTIQHSALVHSTSFERRLRSLDSGQPQSLSSVRLGSNCLSDFTSCNCEDWCQLASMIY